MSVASLPPPAHGRRQEKDHALEAAEVLTALGVEPERGLDADEVQRRRGVHGPNVLRRIRGRAAWRILAGQFTSVIVWLLGAAALLSFLFRDWTEGVVIVLVLAVNSALGFVTELRAVRSMEALRRMTVVHAVVRRDGRTVRLSAEDLVPGDVVLLDAGDAVTADLRLFEAAELQCDESALTGESVPVRKRVSPVALAAPLAERTCMAFKGTTVTGGAGAGVVVATGMATELGRISALIARAEGERSPLEARLDRLGRQLVWATLALTAVVAALGLAQGREALSVVQTSIALAVAAVPEGLPIVATVALARGMWRMADRNVLIERLSAVETLGATTVILTDKTGTLTENRMALVRLALADGDVEAEGGRGEWTRGGRRVSVESDAALATALRVAALCNNAALEGEDAGGTGVGDPTELALLRAAVQSGVRPLTGELPRVRQEPFASETRMMATLHAAKGGFLVAVKGAPEAVIRRTSAVLSADGVRPLDEAARRTWLTRNEGLARGGLRVLALAYRETPQAPEDLYDELVLVGLAGLLDPPRADVAPAIAAARHAGVRVVMLTGDHAATAAAIADAVGLTAAGRATAVDAGQIDDVEDLTPEARARLRSVPVFARVSPQAKLAIVGLHQQDGQVVAMTGDGVNDAPALKKADIGVAMGRRGTSVAREAADMVLRDDAFASIVAAMREGRVIYANIRKLVVYLLSCNLSEILLIAAAIVAGLPLPLLPLQILYLNLVTDVFPAFALGFGEGDRGVLDRPPRDPAEPIVGGRRWIGVLSYASLITAATLGAFVLALAQLRLPPPEAVTISFLTLALAQLWHVLNMRERGSGLLRNEITTNPYVWGALALCFGLIGLALYLPALATVLALKAPDAAGWALAVGFSLVPLIVGQLTRVRFRRSGRAAP